jgi:hypothetical protein
LSEELPPSLEGKLPAPVENADVIATLTTGIAGVIASVWFPITAGIARTVIALAIERCVHQPQKLLLEELRKGNVRNLSNAQLTAFVPMGYKFFEAAKEGEYQHNLSILAAYLTDELKQDVPEPASFSRMVRRVEGLSKTDLKVIALIDAFLSNVDPAFGLVEGTERRPFVSAGALTCSTYNTHNLSRTDIQEALVDIAARGFLIADGATRLNKPEEWYFPSSFKI